MLIAATQGEPHQNDNIDGGEADEKPDDDSRV
jgi:hypothetical protein